MDAILYDSIGNGYNQTRSADPVIADGIYKTICQGAGEYMDIGCGTGNYTIAMASKGLKVTGVDPSEIMLEIARSRNTAITWIKGKAEDIPAGDNNYKGIFGTLTLHHWENIENGFKELYRVLGAGGRLCFFTSTPQQMEGYWLNHYFPAMLRDSIRQMPSFETLANAAVKAGLELLPPEKYYIQDGLKDHFLYVGKNKPELYFEPVIRSGISSFAALSNAEEVKCGLEQLKEDITSGKFEEIRSGYENSLGDYLFFKAVKPQ